MRSESPATRGRELKQELPVPGVGRAQSPATRGRELKLYGADCRCDALGGCVAGNPSAADTHLALPPAAVGRTAVERRPYQADFAKCGGSRRVVEVPPRWRLSQLVRRRDGGFPCGRDKRGPPGAARRDASPHRAMTVTRDA